MGTTLMDEPGKGPKKQQGTTLMGSPSGSGTRLAEPLSAKGGPEAEAGDASAHSPVTGWLVIIEGPGRGRSLELGYGMNIVGRSASNRVALDFGDDQISGDDHFRIAYDGANRQFHLVPGRGTNLVYIGGDPLLTPVSLETGSELKVGGTKLRFVSLCGSEWDWEA